MVFWMAALGLAAMGETKPPRKVTAPNLVKNPSFEIDANGDGVPDGWTHGAGHFGRWQEKVKQQLGKGGLAKTRAASGQRSIRIVVPKDNQGKYWNQGWEGMSFRQNDVTGYQCLN